ncbi:MAG: helix-turn-helix domain-containing protein [Parvibaculum sp.]|uniref:helix-turn-helix domain-containing protein n=1 Tax=Parvibaculum sp. TaxID=2024848 RepID=UPI0027251529|nr:helix-turn-helix domain-containing protein [Parvibaculum sp.]MDO8840489.1 helix-turn-helix domain-containing protein [Parvibaculum sp.]
MSVTVNAAHLAYPSYISPRTSGHRGDTSQHLEWLGHDDDGAARGDISSLQGVGAVLKFDRNETIFNDGDCATFSYRVVSGAVRLCKLFSDGRRQIADFCLPNDYFGFAWTDEYALTAEAVSDVVLVRYPRKQIERLEQVSSSLREHLTALLHRNLSSAQSHILMLGRQTVRERVASFLLLMLKRQGCEGCDGDRLDLPMGRQDIADYLGLTIETVCRALSDLKRAGVVAAPTARAIVVENAAALRAMATGKA